MSEATARKLHSAQSYLNAIETHQKINQKLVSRRNALNRGEYGHSIDEEMRDYRDTERLVDAYELVINDLREDFCRFCVRYKHELERDVFPQRFEATQKEQK